MRLLEQVYTELESLGRGFGLKADVFHGGSAYGPQMKSLSDGLDILVATPGRVMDHLQKGALSLADVRHAVLDEADEMLNMGFADDIETIFSYVDVRAAAGRVGVCACPRAHSGSSFFFVGVDDLTEGGRPSGPFVRPSCRESRL